MYIICMSRLFDRDRVFKKQKKFPTTIHSKIFTGKPLPVKEEYLFHIYKEDK